MRLIKNSESYFCDVFFLKKQAAAWYCKWQGEYILAAYTTGLVCF